MPDPRTLKIGDLVRFTELPEEWRRPGYALPKDSVAFMKVLLRRKSPSRVFQIDEYGMPWIAARIHRRHRYEHHLWGIFERTGWRKVARRS